MRTMALDVGQKAIGIAVSDPLGWGPSLLTTIRRTSLRADLEALAALAAEHGVEEMVVGYPLNMDGSVGPAARRMDRLIEEIRSVLSQPIHRMDERLSTQEAFEKISQRRHLDRKTRRRQRDEVAAAIILQRYLEKEPPLD
ncbi:MAG: Holliday junction resolvase RuvX [Acidobacteriota bacterium]